MKPFRILREQMEARQRAREMGNVKINLDLDYRLKNTDSLYKRFIEEYEAEEVNEQLRNMQSLLASPDQVREMQSRADEIKRAFFASLGSMAPRVTALLIRTAVDLRYRKTLPNGGMTVEVPRKGPEKTKPGVWWGEIQALLEDHPTEIELSPIIAQWLVATWQDEKVQNGFPGEVQTWVNVLDTEMERVQAALEGKSE